MATGTKSNKVAITRTEAHAMADGARARTEVLWINEAAEAARQGPLFATMS